MTVTVNNTVYEIVWNDPYKVIESGKLVSITNTGTSTGIVETITSANNNISIDSTDPANPELTWQLVDNQNLLTDDEIAVVQATSGTNTGDQESSDFDIKDLTDSTSLRTTWSGKQDALGFTPENVSNKKTSLSDNSDTYYPSQKAVKTVVDGKENFHGIETFGALSFDNSTHVLTVASGTNTYWYKGTKYTTANAITCDIDSFETLTANTLYFFYFDDVSGTLKCSDTAWNFKENVFVCTVFWNGTAGAIQKELHNHTRDLDWHIWAHDTIGTRYESGFVLTAPTTAADSTLQIEAGCLHDEDQEQVTTQQTTMRAWYKVDSTHYTFADYSLPYPGTSGQPQYLDTDTYTLTNVGASDFVNIWVYGSLDNDKPIYIIPTHASTAYNTIGIARAATTPEIIGMNLNPELKLLYRFIYKGDGEFQEFTDYRTSSTVPGGGSTAITASAVTYSPDGNISSTNVQSAITELDSEKEPILTGATIKNTIHDNDRFIQLDSEATNATKYNLWSVIKSTLKTYFDGIYQATGNYFNKTSDDLDDILDGTTYAKISSANLTDLTDSGATTLHKHSYNNLDDKPTIPSSVVWYEVKTWTVQNEIKVPSSGADVLPPFEVNLATNQSAKIIKWSGAIESGTSATFKLQKSDGAGGAFGDVTGFTGFAISGGYTNPSASNPDDVSLSDGEVIQPVCTAVSGTPKNLSLNVVIEYTKTI
jgi:hypothetical protein